MIIRILPRDICIEVAKAVRFVEGEYPENDLDLLCWLPDYVFGRSFEVRDINGSFEIETIGPANTPSEGIKELWYVPPYFVEFVKEEET